MPTSPMSPGPSHDLLVSIINYKTGQMTIDCVKSVLADLASSPSISGRIVVVDNASGDGSDKAIADWIADQGSAVPVTLVCSPTNSGFSGGHNQSIAAGEAEYYLVLNSDAVLREGFCKAILKTAEAHPHAGLIAPKIEYDDGEQQINCFRVPSPVSELIRGAQTGFVTKAFKRHEVALEIPPAPDQIGWASFACILLRSKMIEEIGLMDDGYFLYFEDTEYCLRARRAGWDIIHEPAARVVHFRGGSGPVKSLAKARKRLPPYYYASRSRLLYQAHGRAGLIAANLLWYVGRGIAQLRRLVRKPVPGSNAQEAHDIWINFMRPLTPHDAQGPRT